MGCTHSHSEDLRQRSSLLQSQSFMDSLEDVPGYFNRTLTATDYLSSELPSAHANKPEMSFHGPPSHLQNSVDVHPFWSEYGRDYHPKEKFIDRSMEGIPHSLLPGTETAQEMRDIEIRETMKSLRQQVRNVWANKIDEVDGDDANLSSNLSSDVDQTMTQEEKSTLEFFESMINESVDFDLDGNDAMPNSQDFLNSQDRVLEGEQSWNTQEPALTSLLPNNLDKPMVGHVHSIVTEDRHTPKQGSLHRTVPSNNSSSRTTSVPNGHAGFLKNNVYLPKENSITSYHRNLPVSPSRKAPPPTKPKPKRGSGNKRYSYPMTASQPTEFGANFLVANRSSQGSQLMNGNYGNQQNGSPQNSSVSEDMGIVSDVIANNEQNAGVRNIVQRFNQNTQHQQPKQSQSFKQQTRGPPAPLREERTPQKGYRHSMYASTDNATPYGNKNISINGNKNNSNKVTSGPHSKRRLSDDAMSDDSAVDVRKDTTPEDVVLHGIEADLLQLHIT